MLCGGWRSSGTLFVALLGAWLGATAAQNDGPDPSINFNIPRGPLVDAIKQFSDQADVQVTADFGGPQVQQQPVEAIREILTARVALDRILDGSGLTARWHSPKTVRIYPRETVAPHAYDDVGEVLVTGSRIGGGEGPAPVRVYSRTDIDRSGVSSLPGLAGYFTQQPFSFGEWAQRSGAQHFQMRGLGVDTTLVLINGRRAPPSATSTTLNAFDLNTIPLTAVDRIEVMSDSASAIYGADAIGGVVNIILKKGIESPDLYLHYGTVPGGGEERRIAGSIGSSGERLKTSLTVDYFKRGMLLGAQRDIWSNQDYRRFGGTDYRVSTANPGNVYSLTGDALPGLRTSHASVPVGSTGVDLTPEDFAGTDGVVSLNSSNATWSILPDLARVSAFGSVELLLGTNSSLFGEVLFATSDIVAQGDVPSLMGQIVPANNPHNPFGQPVAVDYSLIGMKPISVVTDSDLTRFVLGVRGEVRSWDWELALTGSDERVDSARVNDVDFARVGASLAAMEPEMALNPFTDGPAGSASLLSSLVGEPQKLDYFSGGLQLSGFVRGELIRAPGGMSEFVLGGEWRREEIEFFDVQPMKPARDVGSGFAEVRLPLLDKLWVKFALRGDYYENADDAVNPQYGFVFRPTQDWLVRAAYGTSFRPPSLIELSSLRSEYVIAVADSRRGDMVSPVRYAVGGNPDLENVSGHSFTGGIVYRPSEWPGLQLTAHYWRVVMDNRIIVPRVTDLLASEDTFPGRVTRRPPTQDDIAAGRPGALESVDVSIVNFGRLETSGVDLDVSFRLKRSLGSFLGSLSATWVDVYSSRDLSSTLPVGRVGVANIQGTVPKWRLVGSLAWEGNVWGTSAAARFTPRYRDSDPIGEVDRQLPSRALVDMQLWLELDRILNPGLFDELRVTTGALNLFNREVDFANAGMFLGHDASLAQLNQRFIYLRITKAF